MKNLTFFIMLAVEYLLAVFQLEVISREGVIHGAWLLLGGGEANAAADS